MFSDFSFFFLGPLELPFVRQGFYINTQCDSNPNKNLPGGGMEGRGGGRGGGGSGNESAPLVSDVSESLWQKKDTTTTTSRCQASTLLVFNLPKSPVVLCVLRKYDDEDFITCVEGDHTSMGGANCVLQAFAECFQQEGVKNELDGSWDSVLETFGDDPDKASLAVRSSNWLLSAHKRVLWLGSVAWNDRWSTSPSLVNGSLISAASAAIELKPLPIYEAIRTCTLNHSHYSTNLSVASFSLLTYGIGLEELAVAPSIFLVGFIKSASSFLFKAITSHPQVLAPLRGAQLKESRCYLPIPPRRLLKRLWCFPFVESHEPFAIADGTITYATDPSIPLLLQQDSGGTAKAVVVVRHPVDRIYSQYRAAVETLATKGSFDEFLEGGMKEWDKFGVLRNMVVNGTSEKAVIDHYYNASFRGGSSLATLMMHSIPYPAIAHYMRILGRHNVIVVKSDDLDANNWPKAQTTVHDVYSSLGLCPYNLPRLPAALLGDTIVPPDKQMSQAMYLRLSKFFEPFNKALANIADVNISSWSFQQPPPGLPPISPGSNSSFEPAWFEQEAPRKENGIMAHLLPKGKQEDIGSNTTLGLITMF